MNITFGTNHFPLLLLREPAASPCAEDISNTCQHCTGGSGCTGRSMAERGDSSDEEPTIAEDVVVTKYKMAGDMANRT